MASSSSKHMIIGRISQVAEVWMKHRWHRGHVIQEVIMIHRIIGQARIGLLSNKCVPSKIQELVHVLALELLLLSK